MSSRVPVFVCFCHVLTVWRRPGQELRSFISSTLPILLTLPVLKLADFLSKLTVLCLKVLIGSLGNAFINC